MNQQHRTAPLASERGPYEQHEEELAYNRLDVAEEPPLDSEDTDAQRVEDDEPSTPPLLPDIPSGELDLDLGSFGMQPSEDPEQEKIRKRASNLLLLSESNKKLEAEVKALQDRLEAAERRRLELVAARRGQREQHIMEDPSS